MDRRRAAGALLALAACIATAAAAPTANNQTALDLYDEPTEGCYYNFQHYGEGDRIMTNEPCLNCTCHNRMLMCYLRVCPFTKAIGQDCTVEKRADQCCPIVTCPDVPVDLLTSTSTSSPAEYGGTGVGKVDKYGCSINGKYFPEGAKVPPSPGKPCEHCYCIRNMTTCVMQECTLHVDGCTPIYHKDVCCPVRYFCDHPEDEMPLLDDMTTTVRPTPGFLLTTTAPTEAPEITTLPARRDCIEDDQLYPDGALIKTDKPCEHCYCMKGDIVCVVQECGTPMENEGKNCTSLPPREGQCCPDTYICEGDELSTETPSEELFTTIVPPRRVSVEGSGYRNEPDEAPYTEIPTFATELEGSGEEEPVEKPQKEITENDLNDKYGPTEEAEFIPLTTQVPILDESEKATTEPDKGLNTVPSGVDDEHVEHSVQEKTTISDTLASTESTWQDEQVTTAKVALEEDKTSESSLVKETTPAYESKSTEPTIMEEQTTISSIVSEEKTTAVPKEETPAEEEEENITKSSVVSEPDSQSTAKPEEEMITETSHTDESTPTEANKVTDFPSVDEKDIVPSENTQEPTETFVTSIAPSDEVKTTVSPLTEKTDKTPFMDSRRTTQDIDFGTTPKVAEEEEKTESSISEQTTRQDITVDVTEHPISEQNTVLISTEGSSEAPKPETTTMSDESKIAELPSTEQAAEPVEPMDNESEPSIVVEPTTKRSDTEIPVKPEDIPTDESTTITSKEEEAVITTEPTFKKEEQITIPGESVTDIKVELSTMSSLDITKEFVEPSDKTITTERISTSEPEVPELKPTTSQLPEQQEQETTSLKEATTESIMELSTFAHISDKESSTTLVPESEAVPTVAATENIDLSDTTTINPADNEIAEVPSPGRIPGEGDCLLEGTTYKNDSIVPSMNKCHSGCKCVSSIIKCDPIICSPPPEDMDNCQPRYDTPEACCPTYICDHGMETIPPQPQSHITGTESPTPTTIECHGDVCEKVDEKQPSVELPQTPVKVETSDCGSSGCDQAAQTPAESCADGKCDLPQKPTEVEQPHKIPTKELPQPCTSPEDCKDIKIPVLCEGESCTASQSDQCDKEGGCVAKPDAIPQEETPQVCTSEEECKQVRIPQPESATCEGESCTNVQEDCSGSKCKITPPPLPSQGGEICSEESGCKKPDENVPCESGKCQEKETIDKTEAECSEEDCMQQQPISPTQEIPYSEPISTASPSIEETTLRQATEEKESQPATSELPSTLSEEAATAEPTTTGEPDKEIKEPEAPLPHEEEKVTKAPEEIETSYAPEVTSEEYINEDTEEKTTEYSSKEGTSPGVLVTETLLEYTTATTYEAESPEISATESTPLAVEEAKPTEGKIEQPDEVTESQDLYTDTPKVTLEEEHEISTEVTQQQYDNIKPSETPDTPLTEEGTKAPEVEQELIPVTPKIETTKPDSSLTEKPGPEIVTVEVPAESTKLSDTSEVSTESGLIVTETSVQETQETEEPKLFTISEQLETQTEETSKSPALHEQEITTPAYEIETPAVYITEQQEVITELPKEEIEKVTTHIPERSGSEDQFEATVRPSDVSQTDISLPETDGKDFTTEVSAHITPSVEQIPSEQEGSQATLSPEILEIVTPSEQAKPEEPVSVDDNDKVTQVPETLVIGEEKETESPLSLVTTQPQDDVSTISSITEREEIPESTSPISQLHEIEDEVKTQAPETHVPTATASPIDVEKTEAPQHPITEQESLTEKISTEKLDEEPPVTEQQKPTPEVSVPVSVETETPISDEQEHPVTRIPQISETEAPVYIQETFTSQEPETPEIQEKSTESPIQPTISEKEGEKETDSHEPAITEEYETSTGEPEKAVDEEQHVTVTEEAFMQPQEAITKEPESHITKTDQPIESSEELEKEKTTEKPLSDKDKDVTIVPETIASIEPELPVTEGIEIPGQPADDKSTTVSPVSENEFTQTPGEFITKETITKSPELHETAQFELEEKLTTIAPEVDETEPQKPTTEQPAEEDTQTKLPEQGPTQEHETELAPVTNASVSPLEEAQTELPKISTTLNELVSSVISEGTTISPKIPEEEKQTERPLSFTESTEPTLGSDRTGQEQEPTDTIQEELPEATTASLEASTMIPVLEEDKQRLPMEPLQTSRPEVEHSETTPYLVELEEHTHKMDEEVATVATSDESPVAPSEEPTVAPSEESTTGPTEIPASVSSEKPAIVPTENLTSSPLDETTIVSSEEPDISPTEEPVVSLSEEPTVTSSDEPTVSSSEEPAVSSSEEPTALSEEPTMIPQEEYAVDMTEEPTTSRSESHETEPQIIEATTVKLAIEEQHPELPEIETERPSDQKEPIPEATEEPHTIASFEEATEKSTWATPIEETTSEHVKPTATLVDKLGDSEDEDKEKEASTPKPEDNMTQGPSIETEKPDSVVEPEKDVTAKPQYVPVETTAPEEEFIPVTAKATTAKAEIEAHTQPPATTLEEKPVELPSSTSAPEIPKPDELLPTDEVPSPEEESHFPPSGGYNQEPDYVEEDQAFGPGTCRYGGKVYVSAQQIPRDDPCDFCFCFRSDIICLQQSCPPPIHGCHEEPIQGFCCPRYECPVSMATTLNVTTTTTTTTTTLPPHFLPHAYKGAATRKGCQIKGHTYHVGEVVRASSGPCLHCTCGGDGQMKCDPKQCTPEPMLRQMIAAAVSAKRRR